MYKYLTSSFLLLFILFFSQSSAQSDPNSEANSFENDSAKIYTLLDKAWEWRQKSTLQAQKFAHQALQLAQSIRYEKGQAMAFCQIAINYDIAAQKDSALVYYYKALEIQEQTNDLGGQSTTLHNIAVVYQSIENYSQAVKLYKKSLAIDEQYGDTIGIAKVYINLGICYKNDGAYQAAEEAYKKAIQLFEQKNYFQVLSSCYANLANLYLTKNEIQLAEEMSNKTLELLQEYPHPSAEISAYGVLSDVASSRFNYTKAIQYAQLQLTIIEDSGRKGRLTEVYRKLSSIYEQQGNYLQALSYMRQYADSSTAMLNQDFNEQFAKLQVQYETAEQARQLKAARLKTAEEEALRKEKEIQLTKAVNFRNIFILSAIILLLIALLLYLRNRNSQKLNAVYKEKNQIAAMALTQKELLLKELNHRVKNNLQLIISILELQMGHLDDPQAIAALKDSTKRVQSITLVHDKLHQTENIDRFNIETYLGVLVDEIMDAFETPDQVIQLDFRVEPLILDVRTVVSLGLIINELLTNSFKYAFAERPKGRLSLRLHQEAQVIHLQVEDDGKGFASSQAPGGFGFRIVQSLVRQLDGHLKTNHHKGTQIHIQFKNYTSYASESQDISR